MCKSLIGFIKKRTSIYLFHSGLLKIFLEDIRPGHWNLEYFPCPENVETEQFRGRNKLYYYLNGQNTNAGNY